MQEQQAQGRLGRRARHRHRRSARDGEPARVQPERSRPGRRRRAIAIARPPTSSSRARASSRSSPRPASRPAAITRTPSSTRRRASCASASRRFPTSTTSAPISLTTVLAKSSNVGMTKMAMTLSPQSMHDMLRAFGFGEVTGSGFPGESAGLLVRRIALAQDRAGDDFLRLRIVGDAAAAGARVRDSRRRRHPPSGDAASRRWAGAGRARDRRARRARAAADDGKRRVAGRRDRQSRCARRLSRCRQNRDSVDRRRGRILIGPLQGVVRRRRARQPSAARCDRRHRRARRHSSSTAATSPRRCLPT